MTSDSNIAGAENIAEILFTKTFSIQFIFNLHFPLKIFFVNLKLFDHRLMFDPKLDVYRN